MDFLVFSDDFGEHPSSCQHLFRHIAREHRVLWVNTIGMRAPRLSLLDARKALRKIRKMVPLDRFAHFPEYMPSAITVTQPCMLPYAHLPLIRRLNARSVIRTVRHELHRLGMHNPIFVTTVPNACDYVGAFGEQKVVYYCVDDFAHWPGLDSAYISRLDEKLIAKSDTLVATSEKLYDRLNQSGKSTHLLTHGVDVEHFSNLPEQEHPILQDIPRPRVGYFGLIDERTDQELVREVAQSLSHVSFVFTGKVETDVSLLTDLANVYFTGPVVYNDLPAVLAGWNICMLPYKVDAFSEHINPLKLKEYLAAGKQIICTPLPTAMKLNKYVKISSCRDEWVRNIQKILQKTKNIKCKKNNEEIKSFIETKDWCFKTKLFLKYAVCDIA